MPFEHASNEHIKLKVEDGLAEIRLDDPDRLNCYSVDLAQDLLEITEDLEQRGNIGAIALTAEGQAFSSGFDTELITGEGSTDEIFEYARPALSWLINTPIPVVAGGRRYAVGGGASLISYVPDISYCDPEMEIWWPEIDWGGLPRSVGSYLYPKIGYKLTLEMILLGEEGKKTAQEAKEMGMINDIVPTEDVDEKTREIADIIAQHEADYGHPSDFMDVMHRLRREDTGASLNYIDWKRQLEE